MIQVEVSGFNLMPNPKIITLDSLHSNLKVPGAGEVVYEKRNGKKWNIFTDHMHGLLLKLGQLFSLNKT